MSIKQLILGLMLFTCGTSAKPGGLKGFCFAGSDALCTCDQLIARGVISCYGECTLAVQVAYCEYYGPCWMASSEEKKLVEADECYPGSEALCGCSELIKRKVIKNFDDCTQEAAVDYCKSNGPCYTEDTPLVTE